MPVQLETRIKRFRGLSTDLKPGHSERPSEPHEAPPAGSVFTETDTGHRYIWTGSWPWVRQEQTIEAALAEMIEQQELILETLAAIVRGHEEFLWEHDAPPK
jgi:hypothetical protein